MYKSRDAANQKYQKNTTARLILSTIEELRILPITPKHFIATKYIFISKLLCVQYFGFLHVIKSNIEVLRLNSFIVEISSVQHFVQT